MMCVRVQMQVFALVPVVKQQNSSVQCVPDAKGARHIYRDLLLFICMCLFCLNASQKLDKREG